MGLTRVGEGLSLGELSLPPGFEGLLPWGLIDNRPFLRCMKGFGLCLWRLGRFEEAQHVFAVFSSFTSSGASRLDSLGRLTLTLRLAWATSSKSMCQVPAAIPPTTQRPFLSVFTVVPPPRSGSSSFTVV